MVPIEKKDQNHMHVLSNGIGGQFSERTLVLSLSYIRHQEANAVIKISVSITSCSECLRPWYQPV